MSFQTPDGVTLYTQLDMDEARETQRTQFNAGVDVGTNATKNDLRTKALDWFKSEVREGTMAQDDALGIFNGLAEALGWATVTKIGSLYTVIVNYQGTTIAEFTDIEADSLSEAEDKVSSDLEVEDVEVSIQVSFNGETCSETVNMTYEFDTDELEFEASEQD